MLLFSFRSMSRKVLALLVVLVVAGLAPGTAVLGFCATMACCLPGGAADGKPTMDVAECCTPVNCYEAPSHELTVSGKAKIFTGSVPAVLPLVAAVPSRPAVSHVLHDASPPRTTADRLASLSVFLI